MTKLYELAEQYRRLLDDKLDTETGQLYEVGEDEFKTRLLELEDIFKDKIIGCGKLCKELDSDITAIESEISRLTRRKNSLFNRFEWLKSYMLSEMTQFNLDEYKIPTLTVKVVTNPPSIAIISETDIPREYMRIPDPPLPTPDKKKILEHWKQTSEVIKGTEIVNYKKRIEIK